MMCTHFSRWFPRVLAASVLGLLLSGTLAQAADPATTCEVAKLKAAGKKADCLAKEEAKAILGKPSKPAKCEAAFIRAFANAEAAALASGACPVMGDAAAIERRIDATHVGTVQLLAGEGRLHDNGDGTLTDANTGLTWERKNNNGGLHDKHNIYTWETATGTWISDVNAEGGTGYAGYSDWRVPTAQELQSLLDYSRFGPAIDPVVGHTVAFYYWSSTLFAFNPSYAWDVNFDGGGVGVDFKIGPGCIRAVRGGL
ncbi:MAG: DUF1566 domain-containing protein [Deltaproteobacteria bacterium]|nr:DUF1566 domain-containing protein [Deltaproteobacteria bacterium]